MADGFVRSGLLRPDWTNNINTGLAGWWALREGCGVKASDISGKNNHGTLTNGPLWSGGGLKFDGTDDYISCGNSSILKPVLPISVFAQFTVNSLAANKAIFGNDDGANYAGIMCYVLTTGAVWLTFGDNTGAGSPNRRSKTSTAGVITAGKECTVVGVIRGATDMSIYVNGVDVGGTYSGTGGTMAYSAGAAVIGKNATVYFNGGIKHLRMWSLGLSAAAAQQLSVNPNIGLWVPDTARYRATPAAGGADVRRKIIPAYMRIAA